MPNVLYIMCKTEKVYVRGGLLSSKVYKEYESLSNEELVELSQKGEGTARAVLSARFLNTRGAGVSVSYLDSDDFIQEGMIGFLKAVETYDFSRGVPFEAYAFKCMQNSINTAAIFSTVEIPVGMSSEMPEITDKDEDPLKQVLAGEHLSEVLAACEVTLSDVEKTVVFFRAGGMSYEEIGEKLKMTPKSIDNALQRARKKLKSVCSD